MLRSMTYSCGDSAFVTFVGVLWMTGDLVFSVCARFFVFDCDPVIRLNPLVSGSAVAGCNSRALSCLHAGYALDVKYFISMRQTIVSSSFPSVETRLALRGRGLRVRQFRLLVSLRQVFLFQVLGRVQHPVLLAYGSVCFRHDARRVSRRSLLPRFFFVVCKDSRQSFACIVLVPGSGGFSLHAMTWLTIVSIYFFRSAFLGTSFSFFLVLG